FLIFDWQLSWHQKQTKGRKWRLLTKVLSDSKREQKDQVHQPPRLPLLKNGIDEGCLALELPTIHDKVHKLGLRYIFDKPEECNPTL
ncbi:hypothetical protein HAX54_003481, partial [Datura stramonium]|nr:hypothetical protein [Datura stramonium]